MIRIASEVYKESKKLNNADAANVKIGKKHGIEKKQTVLKRLRYANFVDKTTPLMLFNFSLTQTVSLLLVLDQLIVK